MRVYELLELGFGLALKFVVSMANLSALQALNSSNHLVFRALNFSPLSVDSILSFRFLLFCAAPQRGLFSMLLCLSYHFPRTILLFIVVFSFFS